MTNPSDPANYRFDFGIWDCPLFSRLPFVVSISF